MSSKRSRTWQIRAQGWLNMVAEEARDWDMHKLSGKRKFRNWIQKNIPQVGDRIFRGVQEQKRRKNRHRVSRTLPPKEGRRKNSNKGN